jgi:2-dehydro-3-deoxyphosphogluconate aldolase/(4S)-4-hydroxy-2-oxoglutarate aldolase
MDKHAAIERITDEGLIPVIRVPTAREALDVAEAIEKGGVGIIEITMSVPGAIKVLEELADRRGEEILVGAGTVLDTETGRIALLAGARFLVTPALSLKLIELAHRYGVVVIPGAATPTEILTAWEAGADMVKVFPAAHVGGPGFIKALKGPFPQIPLVPTGGVTLENAAAYINAGATAVAVGGELVGKAALEQRDFKVITENTRAFLEAIRKARSGGRGA